MLANIIGTAGTINQIGNILPKLMSVVARVIVMVIIISSFSLINKSLYVSVFPRRIARGVTMIDKRRHFFYIGREEKTLIY